MVQPFRHAFASADDLVAIGAVRVTGRVSFSGHFAYQLIFVCHNSELDNARCVAFDFSFLWHNKFPAHLVPGVPLHFFQALDAEKKRVSVGIVVHVVAVHGFQFGNRIAQRLNILVETQRFVGNGISRLEMLCWDHVNATML